VKPREQVYLIHFERKLAHAQHYIGWTQNLPMRLHHHRTGNGSRLMAAVSKAGIRWVVAATYWEKDRYFERKYKNRHNAAKLCPICRGNLLVCFDCGRVYKTDRWYTWHRENVHG